MCVCPQVCVSVSECMGVCVYIYISNLMMHYHFESYLLLLIKQIIYLAIYLSIRNVYYIEIYSTFYSLYSYIV